MGKLLIFFITFNALSISLDNIFQNNLLVIDNIKYGDMIEKMAVSSLKQTDRFYYFSKDPDDLISKDFDIPKYFMPHVHFWFNMYTIFSSHQVTIHDKENLAIIYDVIDFNDLKNSDLTYHSKYALQAQYTSKIIKDYKQTLLSIAKNGPKTEFENKIYKNIAKIYPHVKNANDIRKRVFFKLSKNIRSQTGQKDSIQQGIDNFQVYEKTIRKYFKTFNLPYELHAISFLESSFNLRAKSKVGASGVWQFMPFIGKHFMRVDNYIDHRSNPLTSTISALHLLKQNKTILKRWDLAIPAYNSGTKHLLKARRKLRKHKKKISLENIFKFYSHSHIGFASKNFYTEFLALVYALSYKENFYIIQKKRNFPEIHAYVSLCRTRPKTFFKKYNKQWPLASDINSHFSRRTKGLLLQKKKIFFSFNKINNKKYHFINVNMMKKRYPKNWKKLTSKRCPKGV